MALPLPVLVEDLHSFQHVADYGGVALAPRARFRVDPHCSKTGASAGYVSDRVVTDHLSALAESCVVSLGRVFEQLGIGLADALGSRQGVGVDGLGQPGLRDLPELVVCCIVGDDRYRPCTPPPWSVYYYAAAPGTV
ncbi:hypothetical protein Mth01_38070 [Sphaerimonospora thailandensis]|uniref:Uncharacterized protein n=1 Tax=Sphaerimonospora thailandensis TaxID=795644 RepID=A0A8J3VZU8_9ACTN|nr:hypothetical protein Mth01_38070 [Sphaerimonospora thailandensis]